MRKMYCMAYQPSTATTTAVITCMTANMRRRWAMPSRSVKRRHADMTALACRRAGADEGHQRSGND